MQNLIQNPLTRTDSYKESHFKQYPPGTEIVYSYLESRGGFFDKALMVGLQYYLRSYLAGQFFKREHVYDAHNLCQKHFGQNDCFNMEGWLRLHDKYGGRLPLRIRALPEGSVVGTHNALMTIENTDVEFPWLTNWVETMLLKVWYPITVGTYSREIRQIIGKALVKTGDPAGLPFKLHDFGYRGVSSEESAAIGGFAHLVNFMGTDTLASIALARQFYGADMPGYSIPASEHSTMTSWGEANEAKAYENMLNQYPSGLVACVSDSYDIRNAVEKIWGGVLREQVMGRNGTLVIRPDSGNPLELLPEIFQALEARFGLDNTALGAKKGYKVLAPCVRVIQGDGVNYHTIQNIVARITQQGWSMDNLAFGMGGALLQQLNRDTLQFAIKCSAIRINGVWKDVYKHPATDPTKNSKAGRFVVGDSGAGFVTLPFNENVINTNDRLQTVFENGEVVNPTSLEEIRNRAATYDTFGG